MLMEGLRSVALDALQNTEFYPASGQKRLNLMIENDLIGVFTAAGVGCAYTCILP